MLNMIRDKKGALLVVSIIIIFFTFVSLLRAVALRISLPPGALGSATYLHGGIEMHGFTVTAYCPGSCCNGIWAGRTATGKSIDYYTKRKMNIAAVDPAVIPMGTLFAYRGREYLAVDIGGKIRGKRIDLLMPTHQETCHFGVKRDQAIRIISTRPLETSRSGAGMTAPMRIAHSLLYGSVQ